MKKIYIICASAILFFSACEDSGSSTIGTYENEETSESAHAPEEGVKEPVTGHNIESENKTSLDSLKNTSHDSLSTIEEEKH